MAETKKARLSREDWLYAGFRALVESGPEGLKAERIARALGTTKGSFYWHFKDVPDFKAQMLDLWQTRAFEDIVATVEQIDNPTQRLYALAENVTNPTEADVLNYGGHAAEPAIRAWARSDAGAARAVAEIDARRLGFLQKTLSEIGIQNPEFARVIYGAHIGMSTLSAGDGINNHSAMSSLLAAVVSIGEA
ncbi:MAG: transcriptional regulator [Rhodobacterales bacterium]|nr:MAG: transcriptional regulator [Rhodobacterales bacterium]